MLPISTKYYSDFHCVAPWLVWSGRLVDGLKHVLTMSWHTLAGARGAGRGDGGRHGMHSTSWSTNPTGKTAFSFTRDCSKPSRLSLMKVDSFLNIYKLNTAQSG